MGTGLVSWSQTASSNANADTNANWAEGMSPSQVNDSARAIMASMAKWRDDNSGTLSSSGTAGAYTVTSNQGFASLTALDGQTLCIKIHATNLSTAATLNVDSLGPKPITDDGTVPIAQYGLGSGGISEFLYNNSLGTFAVKEIPVDAYYVFLTGQISAFAQVTPDSHFWLLCNGQAVSRTTYSGLFNVIAGVFGTGDGSTTFNVPTIANLGTAISYYIHT